MSQDVLRVAAVLGEMGFGGVDAVVMNYYKHIDHDKIQFDFYVHDDSKNPQIDEITKLGGRVFLIPKYTHVIKYCKTLFFYFQKYKYRIVHVNLNTLSVFAQFSAWKAGVPIRITHNHSTAGKGETVRNIMKYILRLFANCFVTNRCACSRYAGVWMWGRKKMKEGEITIWPNAIDTSQFQFNQNLRNKVRLEYHVENKFVIGHVGRFVTQKNHVFLINMFYELQKQRDDVVLMLIGEGKLENKIRDLVKSLHIEDKVIFAGVTNKPWEFYDAFDIFVLPSLYEGLPVVGIEAQSSGLPCIFSETITREVEMSKAIFLPIDKGYRPWLSVLEEATVDIDSRKYYRDKKLAYFDINNEGQKLTNWYIRLNENIDN